jgi:apolipoprotein D and lipocalin family protein
MRTLLRIATLSLAAALLGCDDTPTLAPVAQVDLHRFMGDWYVIAHIPARPERNAYNAVESYALDDKGRVQTTFRYRDGGFDAPLETMRPVGYVRPDTNNAVWGMRVVWPIKAEYVIAYLDEAYTTTIIGRSKRDYAWIMARTPTMDDAAYEGLLVRLEGMGYARSAVRRVPQQWPETRTDRPPLPTR